jgi:endonuclease-3
MRTLERRHPRKDWSAGMTPFEILLSTILSQSTTVANERRGLQGLREVVGRITPETIAAVSESAIARAIWHAGLARQKAPRIRACAREVRDRWSGSLAPVLSLPTAEARNALMSLPGVGPKTADVVLAMAGNHPTFPVDTHVARIARRWNLVSRADYEATRAALEGWTPPDKRMTWHLAIIAHGRELCRARNPLCDACPVRRACDWYRSRQGPSRRAVRPRKRNGRNP